MLTCEALVTPITKQYFLFIRVIAVKTYNNHAKGYKPLPYIEQVPKRKALPGFFLCIFSSLFPWPTGLGHGSQITVK
jgi:hypothetical protein